MTDIVNYPNGEPIGRGAGAGHASLPAHTVYTHTYDSAEGNIPSADTVTEFILIPAGSYVTNVQIEVLNIEAVTTIDVGDSVDPNGYVAAQAMAVAGRFDGAGALLANMTVKTQYYAVDTWLEFTVGGADATVAKFRISVAVTNLG